MDKLREFQAKQRERKDELEKLIKKEKYELELKHRKEKSDLELKHSRMRSQLKNQLYSERENRALETNEKKALKRKARIENDLYEIITLEEEQRKNKKSKSSENLFVLSDVTNQSRSVIKTLVENDKLDREESLENETDLINSFQQQQQQQQPVRLNDSLFNQTIDLSQYETENIAKTLLGLNKMS